MDVALAMLGRRDFSCAELAQRLLAKGFDQARVDDTISRLLAHNYLNDTRYAAAVVSTRARLSGWGRRRIALDLQKRGLPAPVAKQALDAWEHEKAQAEGAADWQTQAADLLQRKFGQWHKGLEPKEYNRRLGFLLRRGYTLDQARHAMDATRITDE